MQCRSTLTDDIFMLGLVHFNVDHRAARFLEAQTRFQANLSGHVKKHPQYLPMVHILDNFHRFDHAFLFPSNNNFILFDAWRWYVDAYRVFLQNIILT